MTSGTPLSPPSSATAPCPATPAMPTCSAPSSAAASAASPSAAPGPGGLATAATVPWPIAASSLASASAPLSRGEHLEGVVWSDVSRFLLDPQVLIDELLAESSDQRAQAVAEAERDSLLANRSAVQDRRKRAIDLYTRAKLSDDEFDAIAADVEREIRVLDDRLDDLEPEDGDLDDAVSDDVLAEIRERLEADLSDAERREIVQLLVRRITVHTTLTDRGRKQVRVVIDYRFPPVGEARTGKRAATRPIFERDGTRDTVILVMLEDDKTRLRRQTARQSRALIEDGVAVTLFVGGDAGVGGDVANGIGQDDLQSKGVEAGCMNALEARRGQGGSASRRRESTERHRSAQKAGRQARTLGEGMRHRPTGTDTRPVRRTTPSAGRASSHPGRWRRHARPYHAHLRGDGRRLW